MPKFDINDRVIFNGNMHTITNVFTTNGDYVEYELLGVKKLVPEGQLVSTNTPKIPPGETKIKAFPSYNIKDIDFSLIRKHPVDSGTSSTYTLITEELKNFLDSDEESS